MTTVVCDFLHGVSSARYRSCMRQSAKIVPSKSPHLGYLGYCSLKNLVVFTLFFVYKICILYQVGIYAKMTVIRKIDCTCVSKEVQIVDQFYLPKCAYLVLYEIRTVSNVRLKRFLYKRGSNWQILV